jgi:ATP-dependent Clp protease ATP-binding subunit ClpC
LALFERFTDRARQVITLAQQEARGLAHNYIGTEHLLLGLLREREGLAAQVLESLDVDIGPVRDAVRRIVGPGEEAVPGQIPFTPRTKKVLELALREALTLNHNYIGTEHILLGLVGENEGVGARILAEAGLEPERIRNAVIRKLSEYGPPSGPRKPPGEAGPARGAPSPFDEWISVGPGAAVRRLLMIAAARALDDGRSQITSRDLLLALMRDEHMAPVLAELGVDEEAVSRALERRRPPEAPPQASAG